MERTAAERVNRRNFMKRASAFALVVPALDIGALGLLGCNPARSFSRSGLSNDSPVVPWKTTIVSREEQGEPLIISGTIYAPDGKTPLSEMNLSVYHTDATGRYSTSGGDNRNTRINGTMRTNADGRYEFRTIKPAPYPGGGNPAHIHAYISGPDYPEYWIESYVFEGDPFINENMKRNAAGQGNFSFILALKRDKEGVWQGVRDIKVERCGRNCTGQL